MITIEKVDLQSRKQIEEFVHFPFLLYQGVKQWVPPILADIRMMMNKNKHPFYEHSDADFFVARQDGRMVARIGLLENKPYNQYHGKKQASFYLFECVDDQSVADKLFEFSFDWVKSRKLNKLLGPKGFSPFDGYGFLVEGFEHRQMMVMMNYNLPNYPKFVEKIGFTKVVDWVSCYTSIDEFHMPEKVHEVAAILEKRGAFKVLRFKNKAELKKWGMKIGHAYNKTFVNNWEYYPLTEKEIVFNVNNLLTLAVPDLFKIITYKDEVVGFLLAFPDVSAALQRQKGAITPWAIADYLLEVKRTDWVSFNGVGVLPEYHGRGGNYLMFSEMEKSAHGYHFRHGELTQVAESATQMRKDLVNLGVKPYKNHRIYGIDV
jgi:hypothetical protein